MNNQIYFVCILLYIFHLFNYVELKETEHFLHGDNETSVFIKSPQRQNVPSDLPTSKITIASGRLPLSIRPFHYTLRLQPFIHGNKSIMGDVSIDFQVHEETDKIILNMVDIVTVNESCKVRPHDTSESEPGILQQSYDPELQFYVILLNSTLLTGNNYTLSLLYRGFLNSKLVGFYLSTYKDPSGNERRLASTQFSPTDARRAFPCFDEPGFKATFDVSLAREENMTSLSNMPLIGTQQISSQDGWYLDQFNTTLRMSTYLVGFLISDFVNVSSPVLNNTEFRVWSRAEAINQTEYVLEVGPKILLFLEDYFGVDFPLPKLDMAAIPNFKFSGMENWGLIMYRESAMLFDPSLSTVQSKRRIMEVVSHEIAHMWFGNLVTPEWWAELWLKEGFANFMGYKAADSADPAWKMMDHLVDKSYYTAFDLDGLKSSHPINVKVDRVDRISEIFDDISYNKGASIIRMMQHFLTEPVFKRGMTTYLETLKYKNAVQDDLWNFLTESWKKSKPIVNNSDITVKLVMDTWTLQDGFPVVTVARDGQKVSVSQSRFLIDDDNQSLESNLTAINGDVKRSRDRKWWIPVSFTTESTADFNSTEPQLWISPEDEQLLITDTLPAEKWIILNIQKTGFYRVNYDNATWFMLMNQLHADHLSIHLLNRAQLVDDSFNLARAGLVPYSIPLTLVKYIRMERDITPWSMFLKNFNYIHDLASLTPHLQVFQDYLLDLVIPLYNETGFVVDPQDDYETRSLRNLVTYWACEVGYEPCLDTAKSLFKLWLTLPGTESSSLISSDVKPTVLCNGIRYSSIDIWNKTFQAYLDSNVQTEKADILRALGCTNETAVLKRYLEMALDSASGIIKQDSTYVFSSVSLSKEGRDLTWNLIKEKWNFITEYFGSGSNALSSILRAPTYQFDTDELVLELKKFGEDNKANLGSAQQALKLSIETSELNVKWVERSLPQILKK